MKVLVPIFRFNWYRTLAPVIDECLRRGHDVTCLHNESGENFESNRPSEELFPRFRHGCPAIAGYGDDRSLDEAIMGTRADLILSIDLPLRRWIDRKDWKDRSFQYVAIATPDTLKRLHDRETLEAVDLFFLRSEHEFNACIADRQTDYTELYEIAGRLGKDGARFLQFVEPRLGRQWTVEMVADFRRKVRICGYPLLDALNLVDRSAVRRRMGIPEDRPVVGFWATPTAGRGAHALWDWIFAENRWLFHYLKRLKAYGPSGVIRPLVCEERVVKAVVRFAANNQAFLVTKLRHYQKRGESLFSTYTDLVVGEESYYPHTALELAAISDVMIGFSTSGTPEAVWAGSGVIDIEVPGSRRELLYRSLHFWDGMLNCPGVVWSIGAEAVIRELPERSLDEFRVLPGVAEGYKSRFCGPQGGRFSVAILDNLEIEADRSRQPTVGHR